MATPAPAAASLAHAADFVWVRDGVTAQPALQNMGNLFGSEFWTYLLPPRVGRNGCTATMRPPSAPMTAAGIGHDSVSDDARLSAPQCGARRAAADVARRAQLAPRPISRAADQWPLAHYRLEELASVNALATSASCRRAIFRCALMFHFSDSCRTLRHLAGTAID